MDESIFARVIGSQLSTIVSADASNIFDLKRIRLLRYDMRHLVSRRTRSYDQMLSWWTLEAWDFVAGIHQQPNRHTNHTGNSNVFHRLADT